ncbi:MAG: hypothetical protein HQL73_14495, partial [Magnetococcales bacterium]|nr:hypothetical protein [Magnetococcales bacterium]
LSLPHLLHTTLESIPRSIPYLSVHPALLSQFRQRAANLTGLKIGLAWRGNPQHKNDRNRSIPTPVLARLCQWPGCHIIGLQKQTHADDLETFKECHRFVDWSPWLVDFAATAAAIACTDLVIAVDSAVIHLAGALGHPAWVLLPMVPDWRWGMDAEVSPWYPGMRQFRQIQPGNWEQVIGRVTEAIRNFQNGNHFADS